MSLKKILIGAALATSLMAGTVAAEPKVEVLHWWTSGGEAAAVKVLMDEFTANGGTWTDMPVAGGGGEAAMTALRARVLSGNAPSAVQIQGPAIQEWHEEDALSDLSDVASAEGWDALLPEAIAKIQKCEGKFCAVPVNIHRVDWMWANPALLAKAGVSMPQTWAEFNDAADKLKAMGITPLGHGGQPWQDATIFDAVVLGIGGVEFYKKALMDLNLDALGSDTMVAVFDQMRKMRGYVDDNFAGRDWNLATAMIMNGEAAFQIMGDWAKGEFTNANKTPGNDYLCAPTPGGAFIYNVDSFTMFKVDGDDKKAGQKLLAKLIMGEKFQTAFNLSKGSIPARLGTDLSAFDYCSRRSSYDLNIAASNGSLVPSHAHGMAVRGVFSGAVTDVVTNHFNSDMSSQDAAKALVAAIKNAE